MDNNNDIRKNIKPNSKVVKSICDAEKFCSSQGPITFGQLKSIVKTAMNKRFGLHIGEGGVKAIVRLLPWFIPQIAVAGFFASAARAANKLLGPTLKETKSYKTWWAKTILNIFNVAEGEINTTDPFSKIFFISDGLMELMNEHNKLKFAYYISEIASDMPDNQPVPEFFVENELRHWINQRFLLDPPLEPKQNKSINNIEDINEDLAVWFGKKKKPKGSKQPKGPWVDICRKDKDGKHPPCGRSDADKGSYPKCRAAGVAGKMTDSEKKSACQQKRRVEKKDTQTGKGQKPNWVSHKKKKKNESVRRLITAILREEVNKNNIIR